MGIPASIRASVAALMHAARRAPSWERTLMLIEMVEFGYRCVRRVLENAVSNVCWSSKVRLHILSERE
jgi:hypothetical protein